MWKAIFLRTAQPGRLPSRLQQARLSSSHRVRSFSSAPATAPFIDQDEIGDENMKVLVANRGEIACRVIRTCTSWGIPTVAVYSGADTADARHAQMATEAYRVGDGPTPQESYLRQQEILDIALDSGATYVHPGYGFLSEDASFARKLEAVETEQGKPLKWIGPPASAMESMASKSQAKTIMDQANVPTTPGYMDPLGLPENQEPARLLEHAKRIGFPVLIKAVLGGGGKGMRLVHEPDDFVAALQACQAEARAAFGNADVLLEKYLRNPRHIEVQVLADEHGNVRHLLERDCSLQRRHQKIIEEAPASDLPASLRANLQESAVQAAQAVGYVNAGTVEFLLEQDGDKYDYYFCEMNTRLQVEHPVTELVTGLDLVEWQLRVAAGQTLPPQEELVTSNSSSVHAMEARIYAENPLRGFVPSTGSIWYHQPPNGSNNDNDDDQDSHPAGTAKVVRVDSGLFSSSYKQQQQVVSVYYDPMVSKLIVHGKDRKQTLKHLVEALRNYHIAGNVHTNIDFLLACAEHPAFQNGGIDTGFLDRHGEELVSELAATSCDNHTPALGQAIGALVASLVLEKRWSVTQSEEKLQWRSVSPWSSHQGSWRMGGPAHRVERIFDVASRNVTSENDKTCLSCRYNTDGSMEVQVVEESSKKHLHLEVSRLQADGNKIEVIVNRTQKLLLTTVVRYDEVKNTFQVRMWPHNQTDHAWAVDLLHPLHRQLVESDKNDTEESSNSTTLVPAPMPGRLTQVNVSVGDKVTQGKVLIVMEAMKMEHSMVAPTDGVVTRVNGRVDDVVEDGSVLLELERDG